MYSRAANFWNPFFAPCSGEDKRDSKNETNLGITSSTKKIESIQEQQIFVFGFNLGADLCGATRYTTQICT